MRFLTIVALALLAGVTYGILHDQVTARVCLEYFTVGHPQIFPTRSPTLLALGWGILATWWFALPLGFALACSARLGERPKRSARELVRPLCILLGCIGLLALMAGVAGDLLASKGVIPVNEWVATHIAARSQPAFIADWWAHSASYLGGFLGSIVLCAWVWRSRRYDRPS